MKVVIIGSNGQLGEALTRILARRFDVHGLTHDDIEVADPDSIQSALVSLAPDAVINTAAFHNVPRCQEDLDRSFSLNAAGPHHLALWCEQNGADLVHISTDYVFDGAKQAPYVEEDLPRPLNVYGVSKLAGEHLVQSATERAYVLRTSGLYGRSKCRAKGDNFAQTMLRLARERGHVQVVSDEILTPTFVDDLASNIAELLPTRKYGLYHVTNGGSCSWYEFACRIFEYAGVDVPTEPVTAASFGSTVQRPLYSVLDNRRLRENGLDRMRPWQDALAEYIHSLIKT